jgi:hypothetical protein
MSSSPLVPWQRQGCQVSMARFVRLGYFGLGLGWLQALRDLFGI